MAAGLGEGFWFSVARLAKQFITFNKLLIPLAQSHPKYKHSYTVKFYVDLQINADQVFLHMSASLDFVA